MFCLLFRLGPVIKGFAAAAICRAVMLSQQRHQLQMAGSTKHQMLSLPLL